MGVIVGRALHEAVFTLSEAVDAVIAARGGASPADLEPA
jgi:phosphoribosylformimino-5-aminoimidazole carboxamide ribonucleotide (ProFAR) isomerase